MHTCQMTITVEQRIHEDELLWVTIHTCADCGQREETVAYGLPPADARHRLMAENGRYSVTAANELNLADLRCLQALTGITMPELVAVRSRTPGPFLSGTATEMQFIAECVGVEVAPAAADVPDLVEAIVAPLERWVRPTNRRHAKSC